MLTSERNWSQGNECHASKEKHSARRSESDLLLAATRGSQAAFGELCQRHSAQLFRTVRRIARNKEDAEDALQDAMFKAFVHLHQFDGRSKFSTWLTRIAINAALMIVRKDRARTRMSTNLDGNATAEGRSLEIADSTPGHDTIFAVQEKYALLRKAVSKIRPSLRTAIDLRYLRDCSIEETALKLGVSVGAAKARLFHARTQLRKQITADFRIGSVLQSKTTSEPRDSGYRELLFNQTASER